MGEPVTPRKESYYSIQIKYVQRCVTGTHVTCRFGPSSGEVAEVLWGEPQGEPHLKLWLRV